MRLNEIRKEKLLENADKLHSGKGLQSPQLRTKGSSWPLTVAIFAVVLGLGLVFHAS